MPRLSHCARAGGPTPQRHIDRPRHPAPQADALSRSAPSRHTPAGVPRAGTPSRRPRVSVPVCRGHETRTRITEHMSPLPAPPRPRARAAAPTPPLPVPPLPRSRSTAPGAAVPLPPLSRRRFRCRRSRAAAPPRPVLPFPCRRAQCRRSRAGIPVPPPRCRSAAPDIPARSSSCRPAPQRHYHRVVAARRCAAHDGAGTGCRPVPLAPVPPPPATPLRRRLPATFRSVALAFRPSDRPGLGEAPSGVGAAQTGAPPPSHLRRFGGAARHGLRPGRRPTDHRRSRARAGGPGGGRAALRGRNGGGGDLRSEAPRRV